MGQAVLTKNIKVPYGTALNASVALDQNAKGAKVEPPKTERVAQGCKKREHVMQGCRKTDHLVQELKKTEHLVQESRNRACGAGM